MLHARLLHYLDEVARCQSMRRAGERLNVAGSAINRQILALETDLGTQIFERYHHKLVPTAAGELLIDHVRQTLRGMNQTVDEIEALKGLQKGDVTIGVASGLISSFMPEIVTRVRRSFQRVRLRVSSMSGKQIVTALQEGDLELGLSFDLPTRGLRILGRKPAPLGAVMAPDHDLAGRASVRLVDCADYPLCVAKKTVTLRTRLEAAFASASIPLLPAVETDSVEFMKTLALRPPFITFLSPLNIFYEHRAGGLVYVPVKQAFKEPQIITLAARRQGISSLANRVGDIMRTSLEEDIA